MRTFVLARYNKDGSLDTGFSTDGQVSVPGSNGIASSLTLQDDGKILVAGTSHGHFALMRFNMDGSFDTSFSGDGQVTTAIGAFSDIGQSVTIQSDGKILVSGISYNGTTTDFALARYNTDGSLDITFDSMGSLYGTPSFTEGGAAVLMDSDVPVTDAQLAALNAGAGDYYGSNLTLSRSTGAVADDSFSISSAGALFTISGGNLLTNGQRYASFNSNAGTLTVNFDSFATIATQSLVNDVLRHIIYRNTCDAPPACVQINWTFSDGNTAPKALAVRSRPRAAPRSISPP